MKNIKCCAIAVTLLSMLSTSAFAQDNQGTPEFQKAMREASDRARADAQRGGSIPSAHEGRMGLDGTMSPQHGPSVSGGAKDGGVQGSIRFDHDVGGK